MQNRVQISTVVSEKSRFEFLYIHDLGPRSSNDLDLQYSHTFMYSIRCLLLQTFRSLAAIVSEKSTVFTFSRVIICTIYNGLESPVLHTKFRENRPAGSGEEDF